MQEIMWVKYALFWRDWIGLHISRELWMKVAVFYLSVEHVVIYLEIELALIETSLLYASR